MLAFFNCWTGRFPPMYDYIDRATNKFRSPVSQSPYYTQNTKNLTHSRIHSCPSHTYPLNTLTHHLTSPPPTTTPTPPPPPSRQIAPSSSTAAIISLANPIVIPSSPATSIVLFGPVSARRDASRAVKDACVYDGVCKTESPEGKARRRIGGEVCCGRWGRTRRNVEGGINAVI